MNCGISGLLNSTQYYFKKKWVAMKRHRENVNAWGQPERLHTVWFQLHDSGKGTTTETVKSSVLAKD